MMSKNITELFQEGKYAEVIEACTTQITSGTANSESYIVAAKCMIHTADYIDNDAQQLYANLVSNACKCILSEYILTPAQVLERMYALKNELECEFAPCRAGFLRAKLMRLAAAPSTQGWKNYNNDLWLKSMYFASGGTCAIDSYLLMSEELLKAAKLTQEEAIAKYGNCNEETRYVVAEAKHEILCAERDCARIIFTNTRTLLEERKEGSREALVSLISLVIDRFTTAFILYEGVETSESWGNDINRLLNEFAPDEAYTILMEHAELLTYMLEAFVFPGGKAFSVITGDRSYYLNKLKIVYGFIVQMDPRFEIPALPEQYGVEPQENSGSSGGCYVATAVYGSYDCPQVWTLRRFRDNTLAGTWCGRTFIRAYYVISPTLVKSFGNTEWFKKLWKPTLDRMVERLNGYGVEDTPYDDKTW